ncbi:MAG: 1-acyl-sn-glycerol-3-phosphate acyltransferase [Bradyrhizobiaceae bacterium]|nr:1-acyl-sn-glycerol-3-phosphate acyltransferase [Bradyrhizobiaceae bacterium]
MNLAPQALLRIIQAALFVVIVRPFLAVVIGLKVHHRRNLPKQGPAIIVANHNSHLDTLSLMAQLPLRALWQARPVAALDHFGEGAVGFFARVILRAILIERRGKPGAGALDPVLRALDRKQIVIFFPEGSRGEPEVLGSFRHGISRLVQMRGDVPVVPVYLHNMGKCMPKGSWLFVPFNCAMIVGSPADLSTVAAEAVPSHLRSLIEELATQTSLGRWDLKEGHGLGA